MSITHGMDPDGVDRLGAQLERSGHQLDRIAADIDRMLRVVNWEGPNAARFHQVWPRHRATLRTAARGLTGMASAARNNASDQRRVSGAGAGGIGAPSRGSGWLAAIPGVIPLANFVRSQVSLANDVADTGRTILNGVGGRKIPGFPWAGPLAAVNLASEAAEHRNVRNAWSTGGASGDAYIRSSLDVAWAAASLIPTVGAVNAAWNTGYFIGHQSALVLDQHTGDMGAILDDTRYKTYGTAELTPTQAADLSRRYDGVSGFGRFVKDVVT